jgi:hypothetical protein
MGFQRNRQTITFILPAFLFLLGLSPPRQAASALTLAWDPNTEYDLAGYNIYYGIQPGNYDSITDVGNVTQYTVSNLEAGTQYYFAVTAYDTSGNESDFSEEVSGSSTFIDSDSGGGCFIATAAYGSYLNPHVKILRDFRDEFLIPNPAGKKFVHLYYQYAPRIANHMERYGFLRFLSRLALFPLIGMSSLSLKTSPWPTFLALSAFLLSISTMAVRTHPRKPVNPPFLRYPRLNSTISAVPSSLGIYSIVWYGFLEEREKSNSLKSFRKYIRHEISAALHRYNSYICVFNVNTLNPFDWRASKSFPQFGNIAVPVIQIRNFHLPSIIYSICLAISNTYLILLGFEETYGPETKGKRDLTLSS